MIFNFLRVYMIKYYLEQLEDTKTMIWPHARPWIPPSLLLIISKFCLFSDNKFDYLGFLVDFISAPVISGFTSAASVKVITGQTKALLGLTIGKYRAARGF